MYGYTTSFEESFFQNGVSATELCPRMKEQFAFFKRTIFENTGVLTEEKLVENLKKEFQALCIVNTKKRAQRIYKTLEGEGIYHLSTSMYPKHRKRVLKEIQRDFNKIRNVFLCLPVLWRLVWILISVRFTENLLVWIR